MLSGSTKSRALYVECIWNLQSVRVLFLLLCMLSEHMSEGVAFGKRQGVQRTLRKSRGRGKERHIHLQSLTNIKEQCPFWQQMGCLLDVTERMCPETDDPPERKARALEVLRIDSDESVYMCCCPSPYKACHLADRIAPCDAALKKFVAPLTAEGYSGDNKKARQLGLVALQKARGHVRAADSGCQKHTASSEPLSKCGKPSTCHQRQTFC